MSYDLKYLSGHPLNSNGQTFKRDTHRVQGWQARRRYRLTCWGRRATSGRGGSPPTLSGSADSRGPCFPSPGNKGDDLETVYIETTYIIGSNTDGSITECCKTTNVHIRM